MSEGLSVPGCGAGQLPAPAYQELTSSGGRYRTNILPLPVHILIMKMLDMSTVPLPNHLSSLIDLLLMTEHAACWLTIHQLCHHSFGFFI